MASTPAPSGSTRLPTPSVNQRTLFRHPVGLFLLFMVEMWERFSYYGMRGLLVLYLTAALAAHQLSSGTYSNTLRITQSPAPTEQEEKAGTEPAKTVIELPLTVVVGSTTGPATMGPVGGPESLLKFERMEKKNGKWEVSNGSLGAPTFAAKAGDRPGGDEVRFRVTNTGDRKVNLNMKLLRPYSDEELTRRISAAKADAKGASAADLAKLEQDIRSGDNPNYKVYFKVNDGTSVVSTTIKPEKLRDPRDDPFELSIDINRVDSGRSWTKAEANTLYGWYTGMAYLLPILGGLIADKLIGTHRSMVVGAILITLGHIALGVSGLANMSMDETGMAVFVFGLALITIGTGHFKPSVSVQVGDLYAPGDPRRDGAFSIFYMGINLGAFLCNIVCGTLAATYGWHYGFAAAAVGMILGLLLYLWGKPKYLQGIGETDSIHKNKAWVFFPVGIALAALVGLLFKQGVLGAFDAFVSQEWVYYSLIVLALVYAVWFVSRQEPGDRGPVATIFIYMLFNAVFWLSFEQAGSSLTTFTDELTDRRLGFIWEKVPTPQFQSVNPLLIILFAPIAGMVWTALAKRGKAFGQPFKIGAGLIFVGLGYIVMFLAAMKLNTGVSKVSMVYICGCYFLHTVGEIILSPTGLAYVSKTAPKRHLSSLMGIWFISSFVAGLAAGKVGALVDPIIEGKVKLPWRFGGQADFFLLFVVSSCVAGLIIIAVGPLLTRLQRVRTD